MSPRLKHDRRRRQEVTPGDVLALCCGSTLFADDSFHGDLAAMRAAWRDPDVRARVLTRQRHRHGSLPPWAALAFGPHGERLPTPAEAEAAREEYRSLRDRQCAGSDS
jgi:hypothetical protein